MKNQKAFSLIQTLAAIGIIAVITVALMPALGNYYHSSKLRQDAREIMADLRLAQQMTVSEQVSHGIFFDQAANNYEVIKLSDPELIVKAGNFRVGVEIKEIVGLSGDWAIFNSLGGVENSGEIILQNDRGQMLGVILSPVGHIDIVNEE